MEKHKVVFARLHEGIHHPQCGALDAVFPSPSKSYDNLEMHVDLLGLHISFSIRGATFRLLVPTSGAKVMMLENDATSSGVGRGGPLAKPAVVIKTTSVFAPNKVSGNPSASAPSETL